MSNFTFIREDRDPRLTYLFSAYEQTAHTQPIEYNGKTYCGLVLTFESARRVALMQGWLEITDELTREENEDTKEDIVEENTKEGERRDC